MNPELSHKQRKSMLAGLLTFVVVVSAGLPQRAPQAAVRNAEDLMIVDCLLPGQIRKLGRQATYMSARRPIRTTQADCEIRGGEYVAYDRANYQTALKVWLDQAMAGSAEAQNNVGEIYAKGLGIEPDYGMAFQWFKKASDQGYGRAKINLGYLYEQGLGVNKDPAAAINLYRQASGIQDELMYASVVEVELQARDTRIGSLQQQVQAEQATSAQLREEVERLQRELSQRRAALQSAQDELAATRAKLSQATAQEDAELMKLLENQLLAQESQINNQRTQLAALEQRAGSGAGGGLYAGTPTLQILEPMVVATRGRNTAVYRGAPGKRKLVGRVTQPQLLQRVTVNGVEAPMAANGSFSVEIDVPESGANVTVAALDHRGSESKLDFTVLTQAGAAAGDDVATAPVGKGAGSMPRDVDMGRYFAVVVGNNSYRDSNYPALKSAANDATAVSDMLRKRYGYETTLLLNASRLEILSALDAMREQLKPEDNLLIYYAGHGEIDAASGQGYWVPSDGVAGNNKSWISNSVVSDLLNTIQAKHVLVVADSCYSGTMTRSAVPAFDAATLGEEKWGDWVKAMANGKARIALTSGGVQPVPDTGSGNHSYFARAFLNVLQDNNRLLEAQRLYRELSTSLALSAIDAPLAQAPGYSPIQYAGHEVGEYFFLPKGVGG
ncbi:MAG TPA: caspase family protein [Arenimonas sp.]|nr:caspase family protein [Arenimonas sp.]